MNHAQLINQTSGIVEYYTPAPIVAAAREVLGAIDLDPASSAAANAREVAAGRIPAACCITFACTSEQWFLPLLRRPQCFLQPRTNYLLPDGSTLRGVTKGSVVTYYGPYRDRFAFIFRGLGVVKFPA